MKDEELVDAMLRRFKRARRPGDYPPAGLIIRLSQKRSMDRLWARFLELRPD